MAPVKLALTLGILILSFSDMSTAIPTRAPAHQLAIEVNDVEGAFTVAWRAFMAAETFGTIAQTQQQSASPTDVHRLQWTPELVEEIQSADLPALSEKAIRMQKEGHETQVLLAEMGQESSEHGIADLRNQPKPMTCEAGYVHESFMAAWIAFTEAELKSACSGMLPVGGGALHVQSGPGYIVFARVLAPTTFNQAAVTLSSMSLTR